MIINLPIPISTEESTPTKFKTDESEVKATMYDEKETIFSQPHVCKEFGCGKQLTITEKLFGNKCIRHNNQITKDK